MTQNDYILLIYKNLKGETTLEEQARLQTWLAASANNRAFEEKVVREWEVSQNYAPKVKLDAKADFAALQARIQADKKQEKQGAVVVPMRNRRRSFLRIAAAVAVLLGATWWFFLQAPELEILVTETGAGEQKSIVLADNSTVTLNENSSLRYPAKFSDSERNVELNGEGYFEIEKDKTRPFAVTTSGLEVTVLGTKFNINNLETNKNIRVSVTEGSVEVKQKATQTRVTLTKNQFAVYDKAMQSLNKYSEINTNAAAWKTGILVYQNELWGTVLKDLKQQFGIAITISNNAMLNCNILDNSAIPKDNAITVIKQLATKAQMQLIPIDEDKQEYQLTGGTCQ